MSNSRQIKLGALLSYIAIIINIATGLLFTPWMIHSIGREDYGLYTLSMSVISFFVFDFGLSAAITRFLSQYLAEKDQEKANNCLGLVYRLYFGIDIFIFFILAIFFIFIPHVYQELTPVEIEKFKVIYIVASIYSVISFPFIPLNGILTAHECFIQLKVCDVIHKLIIVACMSVCLILGMGLYALVIVNAFAGIVCILLKYVFIKQYTQQRVTWQYNNRKELYSIATYSGWSTVMSIAQRCIFSIAPSILGALSGSAEIAILGIAITIEGYVYTFASAINGMFLPKVSQLSIVNQPVLPLMIRVGRIQTYIIGLLVFGIIIFGRDFINLWVGEDFNKSYLCCVLIVIPSLFHLPQEVGISYIYAKNQIKKLAVSYSIMAISSLFGSFILSKPLGSLGICISVAVAYFIRTIGMDIILRKDLEINIAQYFKETYSNYLLPLTLSIIIELLIIRFIPMSGWIGLIVQICVFTIIYSAMIFLLSMNDFEKGLIKSIIRKSK